jgi:hypothetical protein
LGEDTTAGRPKGAVGGDAVLGGAVADRRVPERMELFACLAHVRRDALLITGASLRT